MWAHRHLSIAVSVSKPAAGLRAAASAHGRDRGDEAPLRISAHPRVAAPRGLGREPEETYRLYREMGLAVRRRKRKRIGPFERVPLPKPSATNQRWSMDFIADGLADGRRIRCLVIVDDYSRECPVIEVDTSITGTRVAAVLDRIAEERGLPASITVDHGPEFEGQVLDAWAYAQGVRLSFIRPGKPVENAYIESFNGKSATRA
jgi:putative transposase